MFDKFISWLSGHPYLHIFYLTFMFFGLCLGWVVIMLPIYIFDHAKADFVPYFDGIKDIWNTRKDK